MSLLFGTDGIRSVAGGPPLDKATIYRVGYWLAQYLKSLRERPRILLARDTRVSGPWIESILMRAIRDGGGIPENCGVISTPAVSCLTLRMKAQAGIVISASHNPYQDNGIKIFSATGVKFNDAVEEQLEQKILEGECSIPPDLPDLDVNARGPILECVPKYDDPYLQYLRQCLPPGFRLDAMRLVVDCANGALSGLAPGVFAGLGAEVHAIHCQPDGRNINHEAGALHLDKLRNEVLAQGASLGIAFDGDADRAMFVDSAGTTRDGDDVLYLLARYCQPADAPRTVVGTVMANLGLEVALAEAGFKLVRTAVGDRYVLEEMLRSGAVVGGEQSGHIILTNFARTGDGLLTALKVLQVLHEQQKDIAELCLPVKRFPQVLRNIRVREKVPMADIPGLAEAEAACKKQLGPRSRILLRYSGTERLARVMVEGEDETAVAQSAARLASIFENLG
jgi:phosphoglucosamine mutase